MVALTVVDPNHRREISSSRIGVRDGSPGCELPVTEGPLDREGRGPAVKRHGEVHRYSDIHGVPCRDRYVSHGGRRTPKPRCLARARARGATRGEVGAAAGEVV